MKKISLQCLHIIESQKTACKSYLLHNYTNLWFKTSIEVSLSVINSQSFTANYVHQKAVKNEAITRVYKQIICFKKPYIGFDLSVFWLQSHTCKTVIKKETRQSHDKNKIE